MIVNLKMEILKQYKTQRNFAAKIRQPECTVSEIISGKRNIDAKEQKRWARVLHCEPKDIFEGCTI